MITEPASMTFGMMIDLFGLLVLFGFLSLLVVGAGLMISEWIREQLEKYIGYSFKAELTWTKLKSDSDSTATVGGTE